MRRLAPLLTVIVMTAPLLASCGGQAAPALEPGPSATPSPVVRQSGQSVDPTGDQPVRTESAVEPEPAMESIFDFVAGSGASTWPEAEEYEGIGGRIEGWHLAKRLGVADLVVIVDIISVDAATINSSGNTWWHVPHEDRDVPDIAISRQVVAEVVGLIKNREGNMPGRSIIPLASSARAPELPPPPNVGDQIAMSIPGGTVTLDIPDDQWAAYIAEVNSYSTNPENEPPDPTATIDEPNPGTVTLKREPGLAVEVGHRYLLILDGVNIRFLDGTAAFTWWPTFTFELSQFEVDGKTMTFRAPHGEVVTPAALLEAVEAAVGLDTAVAISAYRLDSLPSLLGLRTGG